MFVDMKKILALFICLIFSNATFAIPGWLGFGSDQARCKVNYTRLNLITGAETNIKHTVQYDDIGSFDYNCDNSFFLLSDKINDWLKKGKTNIAANVTAIHCKIRTKDGIFSNEWSDYKICSDNHSMLLTLVVVEHYPNQVGYEFNSCRFVGITESGLSYCK
jgi:hypothetical protein